MNDNTSQYPLPATPSDDLPQIVPITSPKVKDWTGRVFGRLTVLGFAGPDKRWQSRWVCRCTCGKIVVAKANPLKTGNKLSCGCLHSEVTAERNKKHGLSHLPEYRLYRNIITRCENPNFKHYKDYGGRGIAMCAHWRGNFANFLADMGQRPDKQYTVDRIDTNGHYCCGHCEQCKENEWKANCRWATWTEQQNNRRNNHFLEFQGKRLTLAQWGREVGIDQDILSSRLEDGWSTERTLTTPVKAR